MSIYKPITVTREWSILAQMNGMSFPGESRLIVQADNMGQAVGLQQKSRVRFIKRKECRAGRNHSYPHHITFIPIPRETLQINVKGEVRDGWNRLQSYCIYATQGSQPKATVQVVPISQTNISPRNMQIQMYHNAHKNWDQPQRSESKLVGGRHSIGKVRGILRKSGSRERGFKSHRGAMKRQSGGGKDNFSKSNFLTERMD